MPIYQYANIPICQYTNIMIGLPRRACAQVTPGSHNVSNILAYIHPSTYESDTTQLSKV